MNDLSLSAVTMCTSDPSPVISSWIMSSHEYQNLWTPKPSEKLKCIMQPDNMVDKYAVAVMNEGNVVGHLPLGSNGKFAKTVFYF